MGLDIFIQKRKEQNVCYFRKVNFLVKYFADRGFDVKHQIPCRIYKDDIEDLLDRCDKVLNNHELAPELLPTMEGFFFGSTDYDEYYFKDVEEVKSEFTSLLNNFDSLKKNESYWFETWY